jgi:hypothetical protein
MGPRPSIRGGQRMQSAETAMKKLFLLLLTSYALCLIDGCGGSSTPPPSPSISITPTSAQALDVNQSLSVTATVTNGSANQGFDWTLACTGGSCGTITPHTASGAPAVFTAPSGAPTTSVAVTAKLTGSANSDELMVTISLPPTVTTSGAITAANLNTSYSLQLAANGGAGNLTWALGGGTSLPDTLILSPAGTITGTPTGATGTFEFKVHVSDSGNPPLTSPDVSLNVTVNALPLSVGLLPASAYVALNGSTRFVATTTNDPQNGNIDWTLTLNGVACTVAECGSISPATTASGAPTTYTAPASVPPANVTLTATTVDGAPPVNSAATIIVTAHGFVPTGSMATEREAHTATLLDFGSALTNGKVLVAGGVGNNKQPLASAELFDPSSGTFAPTKGSMATARADHTATLLTDGTVLVTGGIDQNGNSLASADLFDPSSGTFTPTKGNMGSPRAYHTATLLKDGTVLVIGGLNGTTGLVTAELFDPASGMFSPTKGNMAAARFYHTATSLVYGPALTSGKVLISGGGIAAAELFDPGTGTFTLTGSLEFARVHDSATLLNDGRVLVTGGGAPTSNPNQGSSATAELFSPADGLFTPTTTDMTTRRANHRTILLNDGTVLVTGGFLVDAIPLYHTPRFTYLASAELFSPASGSFTPTGEMAGPRAYHTTTMLKDGTVLVTGGDDGSGPLATAELYK